MSTSSGESLAAAYAATLPSVAGSLPALLEPLRSVRAPALVLDLGTGVGEPALTLATERPDIEVLGVDHEESYVAWATSAARLRGLTNVRFAAMSYENLELEDGSVAGLVSRHAALMIGDLDATSRELARVLEPEGVFSIAPWGAVSGQAAIELPRRALASVLPEDQLFDFSVLDRVVGEGAREKALREAGMSEVSSDMISWTYPCPDFGTWWALVSDPIFPLGPAFASLDREQTNRVRQALAEILAPYEQPRGGFAIPYGCQLITGCR